MMLGDGDEKEPKALSEPSRQRTIGERFFSLFQCFFDITTFALFLPITEVQGTVLSSRRYPAHAANEWRTHVKCEGDKC